MQQKKNQKKKRSGKKKSVFNEMKTKLKEEVSIKEGGRKKRGLGEEKAGNTRQTQKKRQ